jgi:hypothetical protein
MFGRGKGKQGAGELWSPDGAPAEGEETGRGKKRRFAPGPRIDWQPDTPRAPFTARRPAAAERQVEPEPEPEPAQRERHEEPDNFRDDAEILFEREAPQFDEGRAGDRERRGESRFAHVREHRGDERDERDEHADTDGSTFERAKEIVQKYFEKFVTWVKANPEKAVVLGAGAMALVFGGAGTLGWILGSAILGYVASMATQRRRTMPVFVASSALYWMSSFAIPVPLPLLLILYTAAETAWTKYKKIPPEVHGGAEEHH